MQRATLCRWSWCLDRPPPYWPSRYPHPHTPFPIPIPLSQTSIPPSLFLHTPIHPYLIPITPCSCSPYPHTCTSILPSTTDPAGQQGGDHVPLPAVLLSGEEGQHPPAGSQRAEGALPVCGGLWPHRQGEEVRWEGGGGGGRGGGRVSLRVTVPHTTQQRVQCL